MKDLKMLKSKYLTKKQKGVLEDLFLGGLDVQEILEKWKVTRRTYYRWHAQPFFAAEFKRLLDLAHSQCELVLARYAADVAMKLVSLSAAEKEETARKACMDVIVNYDRKIKRKSENEAKPTEEPLIDLPPEVAGKMLALLAGETRSDLSRRSP
jgi:predicted DNA-binding protein YlxM (UPF0122 family)